MTPGLGDSGRADGDGARGAPVLGEVMLARAEWLYRNRRRRDRWIPMSETLFGEPAFDLLLDLFIHDARARPVSVAAATVAAAVAPPTARRWIETLVECGLAERVATGDDAGRQMLRLSGKGREAMCAYLDDW